MQFVLSPPQKKVKSMLSPGSLPKNKQTFQHHVSSHNALKDNRQQMKNEKSGFTKNRMWKWWWHWQKEPALWARNERKENKPHSFLFTLNRMFCRMDLAQRLILDLSQLAICCPLPILFLGNEYKMCFPQGVETDSVRVASHASFSIPDNKTQHALSSHVRETALPWKSLGAADRKTLWAMEAGSFQVRPLVHGALYQIWWKQ